MPDGRPTFYTGTLFASDVRIGTRKASHPLFLDAYLNLGTDFFVDGNAGLDTNDGKSWEKAKKTVAAGIVVADDDIAKHDHWDRRNRLWVNGGAYTESLVRFPEKTDIIGVGNTDFLAKAKLIGVQVPAAAVMGCRFINMAFQNVTAAETVKLLASCHGTQFIDCDFLGNGTTTVGLKITDCADILVKGCRFYGTGNAALKQLIGIQILGTATCTNFQVRDCDIVAAEGIDVAIDAAISGVIADCNFDCSGLCIDENSDKLLLVNNRLLSSAGNGWAACCDIAITRCVNVVVTTANGTCYDVPPRAGALA
jgi:hypothetical protein